MVSVALASCVDWILEIPEKTPKEIPRKDPQREFQCKTREPLTLNLTLANTQKRGGAKRELTWFSLRRPPSACSGRRYADQIQRGLEPRVDRGRASRRGAARRAVDPGATEMPLDGGAPTLRWMRAPARGLAVAPPSRTPPDADLLSLARSGRGRRRRRGSGEEK
jgi:hypothetical protein